MKTSRLTVIACISILSLLTTTSLIAKTVKASKNYTTRSVKVERFNGISTSDAIDVIYTPSASGATRVEIYAPDNVIDYVDVKVKNGVLTVGSKSKVEFRGKGAPQVRVSAPAVNSMTASGAGDITVNGRLKVNGNLTMSAMSSGDIKCGNASCTGTATLKASSSGDVKIKDLSGCDITANASSSGDVKLANATCTTFTAKASSSGDVKVDNINATNVSATVNSSSDIVISGTCTNFTGNASSSGDIKCSGLKAKNISKSQSSSGSVVCGKRE